jgi:uncharacterized protein YndB with AHSA1/START domain
MADVAAEAQVAAEPITVFAALIDLDRLPGWLSLPVDKLAVPDGALHEFDRFPLTITVADRPVALRCQVTELHRPTRVIYEVSVDDHVIVLRGNCLPTPTGSCVRVSLTDPAALLDPVEATNHLEHSLQCFARGFRDRC